MVRVYRHANGNSFMFAASRNLYALAITGHAPTVFARCSKRGNPDFAFPCAIILTLIRYSILRGVRSICVHHAVFLIDVREIFSCKFSPMANYPSFFPVLINLN